jgi:adenylate kinase
MKIMMIGPQGAGKGTIGEKIKDKFNIPVLSAGQILRDSIKEGTEVGKIAEQYINKGDLVPPEVISNVMKERVLKDDCKNGYILDGFPRTLAQAKLFGEKMNDIDFIIELDAPRELLLHRLTGRRMHKETGKIYNVFSDCDPNPPESMPAEELYQRKDDTKEAIEKRLDIYDHETKPIIEAYKEKVHKIDATGNPDLIFQRVMDVFNA